MVSKKTTFKGRVINEGEGEFECVVSRQGVNTLATFQKSALKNAKKVIGSDQNNPDVYGKNLTGVALILPQTIGSTTGGLVIQTICQMGIAPGAMLFSEEIDSLAASGVLLAKIWENSKLIAIDKIGKEILESAQTGDSVKIFKDGTIELIKKDSK